MIEERRSYFQPVRHTHAINFEEHIILENKLHIRKEDVINIVGTAEVFEDVILAAFKFTATQIVF